MYLYYSLQPAFICFPQGIGQLMGLRACRQLEEAALASVAAFSEH